MSVSFAASKLFNLSGQVALVTGGGTGIGKYISYALAANGAKVYITGRRVEKLEEAIKEFKEKDNGGSLHALQLDVTDRDSIKSVVEQFRQKEQFLSLLVNNAGIAKGSNQQLHQKKDDIEEYSKQMLGYDVDAWDAVYRTNIQAAWFVTGAFLPLLVKAREAKAPAQGGRIINIASISGVTKETQSGQQIYNTSKAAFITLTNHMATEFADQKIRIAVNSICPGYFPSEMTAALPSGDDAQAYRERGVPLARPGLPEEMGSLALMLATNHYIQGQHIVIDGGWLLEHR